MSDQYHAYLIVLAAMIMDFFIQYLCVFKRKLFGNKPIGGTLIESALNDPYRQVNSRTHGQHGNQYYVLAYFLLPLLVHKLFTLEVHHTHSGKRGKTDKYRINEVEIECPKKINQITRCQPVTCRTERRHQSSGNGNTRNYVSFLLGRQGNYTGKTAHQCDEYVINRR